MLLRYFYLEKYNEMFENVDVNLGGAHNFRYLLDVNELFISKNENHVNKLYDKYNVISDVSAILGKNSSGKTTILRIINTIFNSFLDAKRKEYIVAFELDEKILLFTSYEGIKITQIEALVDVEVKRYVHFNSIDNLHDVGLIYFSNIFDKSSPFAGNANLLDISTNSIFEKYCKSKSIMNGIKEKNYCVLDDYKSYSALQEMILLISLYKEYADRNIDLLFKMPREIMFVISRKQDIILPDSKEVDKEYLKILEEIEKLAEDRFIDVEARNYHEVKENFLNENLFYLIFDELYRQSINDKYDIKNALYFFKEKIKNNDWKINEYFIQVLDKMTEDNNAILKEEFSFENADNEVEEDERVKEYEAYKQQEVVSFPDVIFKIEDMMKSIETFEYFNIKRYIIMIQEIDEFFAPMLFYEIEDIMRMISEITSLLDLAEEDLSDHDYDLFNTEILDEVYNWLYKLEVYIYDVFGEESTIVENDIVEDEAEFVKAEFDQEMIDRVSTLRALQEMLTSLVNNNKVDALDNMIRVELNNKTALDFISEFIDLGTLITELYIKRTDISSGHTAYVDMCARLNQAKKEGEICGKNNIILLIDEGDIYLHPEMQIGYLNNLLNMLQIIFENKHVQVIVTSNSPFMISDIQNTNILYLERKHKNDCCEEDKYLEETKDNYQICAINDVISDTFGANINRLLSENFFVDGSLIGKFAYDKINEIIVKINEKGINDENRRDIEAVVNIIGEPIIKKKLESMLYYPKTKLIVESELAYYKNKISVLEKKLEARGK